MAGSTPSPQITTGVEIEYLVKKLHKLIVAEKSKDLLTLVDLRCKKCGQLLGKKEENTGIVEIECWRSKCKAKNIYV